jgi:prepilin-type N-terminal cleavage/methylation domain-containing protein
MKTRLKQSGFTLLEIMIVVVIVGLLASVVAPMVSKSTDDLLKEQADRFIALVKLAQDESILQSRQLGLLRAILFYNSGMIVMIGFSFLKGFLESANYHRVQKPPCIWTVLIYH